MAVVRGILIGVFALAFIGCWLGAMLSLVSYVEKSRERAHRSSIFGSSDPEVRRLLLRFVIFLAGGMGSGALAFAILSKRT
jgi:hypothetical protein